MAFSAKGQTAMVQKGGCKICGIMNTMKQTVMKSLVTRQVEDRMDMGKAIIEAEAVKEGVAEIGAEVLDGKQH